jgi:aryl hydrocarbon receptor
MKTLAVMPTWLFLTVLFSVAQRLDIRGRVKILHGQNRKTEEPPLALFAYCTPFGPPSLLEIPQKENMFKSKHKLDLSLVSMDQR